MEMMKKLLLADDSITIQKVVGIIFSTEEYQLEMTDDGNSAFNKALEEIPDLVIADISMPGKDGFELCRAIKSEPSLSNSNDLKILPSAPFSKSSIFVFNEGVDFHLALMPVTHLPKFARIVARPASVRPATSAA